MQYLSICQQPDSSDLFKSHGPESLGVGVWWIEQQFEGVSPEVGGAQKCEDTTTFRFLMCFLLFQVEF